MNFVGGLWASAECEVCPDNSNDKVISIWTSLPLRQPRKPLLNVINVWSIFTLNDSKDHLRVMTAVYTPVSLSSQTDL